MFDIIYVITANIMILRKIYIFIKSEKLWDITQIMKC